MQSQGRLGFQLEQAYWFYEDFYRSAAPHSLPKVKLKAFCRLLLPRCPVEWPRDWDVDSLVDSFQEYKAQVPTCGAIILNPPMDKVLVVCGFGSTRPTWGFPKGKIAKDEHPSVCAIREVYEEIGLDIAPALDPDAFIQVEGRDERSVRLYIIANVSEETPFAPQTRNEIRDIQWHPIAAIKRGASDAQAKGAPDAPRPAAGQKYYNVLPFMAKLCAWIRQHRPPGAVAPSSSDDDCDTSQGAGRGEAATPSKKGAKKKKKKQTQQQTLAQEEPAIATILPRGKGVPPALAFDLQRAFAVFVAAYDGC